MTSYPEAVVQRRSRVAAGAAGLASPIGDPSRWRRLAKLTADVLIVAAILAVLDAFGIDVGGWLGGLWTTLGEVSPPYLLAAIALQTAGAAAIALGWLAILRAAYPHAEIRYAPVLAAYAVGNALNAVIPAHLGIPVMIFMLLAIIPGSTFAGLLAASVVQSLFFGAMNVLVYLYLFGSVPGSFSVELGAVRAHPLLSAAVVATAAVIVALLARSLREKLRRLWIDVERGGAILRSPRDYAMRVVLPSLAGWFAKVAVIGVMLAAFAVPVTLGSVIGVAGGNSIAGNASVTPGGAGVTQAMSVVALREYTDAQTATAVSVAQQLITTAWNVALALILVFTVFGWTHGRALVKRSYEAARAQAADRRHQRGRRASVDELPEEQQQDAKEPLPLA